MSTLQAPPSRRLPVGSEITAEGTHFRVWAPRRRHVAVCFPACGGPRALGLEPDEGGYFGGLAPGVHSGMRYGFRLDGGDRLFPDPASRFQPDGPDGLSQIIDPAEFQWSDASWQGVPRDGNVLYEMHIGTFTPAGTWAAAASELPALADLGVTIIEVMPVADFPGRFGWGYDGVNLFAPTRLYGEPDDFRRFVDHAHALGVGVILDVVYNHFGAVGNYLSEFSDTYQTARYKNDWGGAINFDGDGSDAVREFFTANVRYWIQEFHLDGFRFDATQDIHDASPSHILSVLAAAARETAGTRRILLVAENEPQDVRLVRPASVGGYGLDCLWNDDFHHAAKVRLTGYREAYYSDYSGAPEEFLAALTRGFIYQGQRSTWQGKPRGTPTWGLPAATFVHFLENHDQIANSLHGTRTHQRTSPGRLRAMTALWLLSPQTPLFFQGQEYAASTPFLFFADWAGDQTRIVTEGRAGFLSQFSSLASPGVLAELPSPADRRTFERCKLDPAERSRRPDMVALHADLLRIRREDPVIRKLRDDRILGATIGSDALLVRYPDDEHGDRLLLVNFGCEVCLSIAPQPLLAAPLDRSWRVLWCSEETRYGGGGTPAVETDGGWRLPGEAAILMRAAPSQER